MSDLSPLVADGDVEATRTLLDSGADAVRLQRNSLLIAAAVVALTGLLAIAQAAARHLAPRREDAHVLAAIGLTTADRRRAGLLAVGPGLVGGALSALLLALLASRLLPLGLARRADPVRGVRVDWPVLAVGLASTLVAVWLCAVVVVRRWVRPDRNDADGRPSLIARVTGDARPAPGPDGRLQPRPRQRSRACPTPGGADARRARRDDGHRRRGAGDPVQPRRPRRRRRTLSGSRGTSSSTSTRPNSAMSACGWLPNPRVAGVEAMHKGEVNLGGAGATIRQVGAIGLEGLTGPMWLAVLEGRDPAGPGEIAVGTSTMRSLDLAVGDMTTVSGPCGERRVEVVGRSVLPLVNGDDPDSGVVLTLSTFDELCAAS